MEHGGTQVMVMITLNDKMATCYDVQVLNLEKKKEKNKTKEFKEKVFDRFCFW